MLGELVDRVLEAYGLALQELGHGSMHLRLRQPVGRGRLHRIESARMLVLALGAALEECEAALDAYSITW